MADEPKAASEQPKDEAATEPQPSAQGQPTDGVASEQPKDEGVKDSHGQEGINKERHDKEVAALNKQIADLKDQLNEASKTEKAREELNKKIQTLTADIETERTAWQLEKAGCRNVKLASKALEDYDGDVDKLKAECPYLFEDDKPMGATGVKPGGAPDDKAARQAKAYDAAGVPPEKRG